MTHSLSSHANFHTKPIIYNSWIMLRIPHTPLYTYHSSYIHTQPKRSSRNKQTSNHITISPSTSLRLRGLAQASPPFRLGKDTKQEQEQRGISLRRDPSRLGELSARSKLKSWPPGRPWAKKAWVTLRQTRLGESDSPGWDYQVSPWIHLQQIQFFQTLQSYKVSHAPQIAIYLYKHPTCSNRSKTTQKQIKDNSNTNPNFPYLERVYARLWHWTTKHSSSRDGLEKWSRRQNWGWADLFEMKKRTLAELFWQRRETTTFLWKSASKWVRAN